MKNLLNPWRMAHVFGQVSPPSTYLFQSQSHSSHDKNHLLLQSLNISCNIGAVSESGIADHLHFHLVPSREEGYNFITVLGDSRSIPKHIERTVLRLFSHFILLFQYNRIF